MSERMKYEKGMMWAKALHQFKSPGSRTARNHGSDHFTTYIVCENNNSLKTATDEWSVKGLFVAYDDIQAALRQHVVVYYKMGCGTILGISIDRDKAINLQHLVLEECVHNGEHGVKIAIETWTKIGNAKKYVVKAGPQKSKHLAHK